MSLLAPLSRKRPGDLARWACCGIGLAAVFGLALGWLPGLQRASRLSPAQPVEPAAATLAWSQTGFAAPAPSGPFSLLRAHGSWIPTEGNADRFVGEARSRWYSLSAQPVVLVAGYPATAGNLLEVELRDPRGEALPAIRRTANPGEQWEVWTPALPANAAFFRLHAVDGLSGFGGWLAFTEPVIVPWSETISWRPVVQAIGVVALALVLVLGPGLLWQAWRGGGLISALWAGPLLLASGGLVCWWGGEAVSPTRLALIWIAVLLAGTFLGAARLRPWQRWTNAETTLLAVVGLAVLGAASRAACSAGPAGELYGGRISRTLEVGAHSDSRISFHNVQLVANHLAPYSEEGQRYYAPDTFSHRGPLAGLIAAPVVLAAGGKPPREMPDQTWQPFDPQGFATFRIVMATLSACAVLAVGGLLLLLRGAPAALAGGGLLALAPFFWHELYFSWPKMAAATWALGGFALILRGRTFVAGLGLGGAYLFHPLALLSVPFAGLWCLFQQQPWSIRIRQAAGLGLGTAAVVAIWIAANQGHYRQNGFFNYFVMADGGLATWTTWWISRWQSFANTLIPGYVWLFHSRHESFNAIGTTSGAWVHYALQAWTSLPFAIGLVAWLTLLPAWVRGVRRYPGAAMVTLIAPTCLILVYWGAATTGIMRQCGHVVFLSSWVFLVWAGGQSLPDWSRSPRFIGARAIEVLAVVWGPTLATSSGLWGPPWALNDLLWFGLAVLSVVGVAALVIRSADHSILSPSPELQLEQPERGHLQQQPTVPEA